MTPSEQDPRDGLTLPSEAPEDGATEMFPEVRKWATFSDDRIYRYELARVWDEETPPVLFIGMNPSTADEEVDDPTIRRCIRFARDWGYGGLLMGNLFAFRATDPKALPSLDDRPLVSPLGEHGEWCGGYRESINDRWLKSMADGAGLVVAAWGAIKVPYGWKGRDDDVRRLLPPMHALALTKDGHPRHPLYVKACSFPRPLPRVPR